MAQQVKKKFIGNDQVDGSKILLEVGQTIRQKDGSGGEIDVIQSIEDSISNEQSRAEAAESALDGRLTTAEGEIDQLQLDVVSNLSTAQAYTDQKIADLVDSAPELLDTLNELAAALGDDPNFATTVANSVAGVQSSLDQEILDRQAADSDLQGQIDDEETRALAAEGVLQGNIDTVSSNLSQEISDRQTLEGEFDAYVVSNDAALAQEISDRQSGDSTLQSNIDTVSSDLAQEISDRQTLEGEFDAYVVSNDAALAQEVSDRTSADSNLQSQIDQVVSDLAQEVLDRQSDVDTEEQRALAAESVLQDNIDAEEAARIAAVQGLQDQIDALDTGFVTEAELASTVSSLQAEIDSDVAAEASLRDAADVVLQGNIDSEESARIAADNALDGRVSVLESVVFFKEKFVLTSTDISNEFVTLSHTPESNSMSAFVDRLAIHEGAGEDYSISGTTMTFLNEMVGAGNQKLQAGDTIYVKYQYKM